MIPFSILDLSPIGQGKSISESFSLSLAMAQRAETHGYQRYWLAEHHGMSGVGSSSPAVLLSHIGAGTSTIRLGAGGIMLPNHAPLVVAEQFGTLAELYPNRIDLGLGRAPGTDMLTARALRRNMQASVDDYPQDVQELERLLGDGPFDKGIVAVPGRRTNLPIWLLGSSLYSAQVAAEFGLPYSFASHFAPDQLMQALTVYRRHFKPKKEEDKPYTMAGIMAVLADTQEEADYLFTSAQQQFVNLRRGGNHAFPAPVESMDTIWSPSESHMVSHALQFAVVGTKASVAHQLSSFIEKTEIDELIISFPVYDGEKLLASLSLMAELRHEMANYVA